VKLEAATKNPQEKAKNEDFTGWMKSWLYLAEQPVNAREAGTAIQAEDAKTWNADGSHPAAISGGGPDLLACPLRISWL